MEVEEHDYALARFDVSKSFGILLIDVQRSLHVGNAPVPGELFGVRTDEADDPQLDAHAESPCVRPDSRSPPLRVQHKAIVQESNWSQAGQRDPQDPGP